MIQVVGVSCQLEEPIGCGGSSCVVSDGMRTHHVEVGEAPDQIATMAVDLARLLGERSQLNKQVLLALLGGLGNTERRQRRFRSVALSRLAKIEAILAEIQGAQLAQLWQQDVCPTRSELRT